MNVLLLGNGFDLHNKLPTAYIDFLYTIQFLKNDYDSSMNTVGKIFGNEVLQNKDKNIKDSYEIYKKIYNSISLDENVVNSLVQRANDNLWFQYLSNFLQKNMSWIDFEKEIARIVNAFNYFFEHLGEPVRDTEQEKIIYLISQFSFFIKGGSGDYNAGYFWDVEDFKDKYAIETPIGTGLYEANKESIISDLSEMLSELSDMLRDYLLYFVDALSKEMNLLGHYIVNPSYPQINVVCTFNYTNTYEFLYNPNVSACHIHGDSSKKIVLGINPDEKDDLNNLDTSFLQFKKYFQRVFYKTDISYLKLMEDLKLTYNSNGKDQVSLYIAGHSLDKTDEDIIQELFGLSNRITIFYHDELAIGKYIKNLVSIYGKKKFDKLRVEKNLEFIQHEEIVRYNSDSNTKMGETIK